MVDKYGDRRLGFEVSNNIRAPA